MEYPRKNNWNNWNWNIWAIAIYLKGWLTIRYNICMLSHHTWLCYKKDKLHQISSLKGLKKRMKTAFLKFSCVLSKVSELFFVLVFLYFGLYFCQICFIIQKTLFFTSFFITVASPKIHGLSKKRINSFVLHSTFRNFAGKWTF